VSSAAVSADLILGSPPPAPPERPRVLVIGTSLGVAAMLIAFGGLIGVYIQERATVLHTGQTWLPTGGDIPTMPGTVAMVGLAFSAVTMLWAHWAIGHDDRPRAYMALGITAVLGLAFLNSMAFFIIQSGLNVHSTTGLLIYTLVGAEMVAVGAGVLFIGVTAFRTLGGQYSSADTEGVTAATIYWFATVAVFFGLWLLIFIEK
jgi:heme/copper-type cytochrome/quinol oxidase subunit 3